MAGALDVVIRFVGNSTSAVEAAAKTEAAYGSMAQKLQKTGLAMSAAFTLPIAIMGAESIKRFEQMGETSVQTAARIKSTGGAANVTAKQVDELANSLFKKTAIDNEQIKSSENMLLSFTKIHNEAGKGNDVFNQATQAALDLSVAYGKDLTQSALLVGKALQDPVKGMTALQRIGVRLTDSQKGVIQQFVQSGDIMGAQKVILDEIEKKVGGAAAAYGTTLAGNVSRAKTELLNAGAAMVGTVAPGLSMIADMASKAAGFMSTLPKPVQEAVTVFALLVAAVGPAVFIIGSFGKVITFLGPAIEAAYVAIQDFVIALAEMSAAEALATGGLTLIAGAMAVFIIHSLLASDATDKAAASGKKWGEQQVENAKAAGDSASQLTTLRSQQVLISTELDNTNVKLGAYRNALREGQGGAEQLGISTGQLASGYKNLSNEAASLQAKHDALAEGIKSVSREQYLAQAAADAQARALAGLAAAAKGVTDANDAEIKSIQGVANAYTAAEGGPAAYTLAVSAQTDAQTAANEAIQKFGLNSPEAAKAAAELTNANIAMAQAAFSMQTTQQTLNNTLQGPGISSLTSYRDSLIQSILTGQDHSGVLQAEADRVNDLIVKQSQVQPSVDTRYTNNAAESFSDVDQLSAKANALNKTIVTTFIADMSSFGNIPGGQVFGGSGVMAGGVVPGPRWSPRLMLLHGGERILPPYKSGTDAGGGNYGSGGGQPIIFDIKVQVPVGTNPVAVGGSVVDAIRAYERVAGTAWRGN